MSKKNKYQNIADEECKQAVIFARVSSEEQRKGAYLVLVTMREGMALEGALMWCEDHGIKFDAVNDNLPHMKEFFKNNPRKIFCNECIDDNNFGGIDYVLEKLRKRKEE